MYALFKLRLPHFSNFQPTYLPYELFPSLLLSLAFSFLSQFLSAFSLHLSDSFCLASFEAFLTLLVLSQAFYLPLIF